MNKVFIFVFLIYSCIMGFGQNIPILKYISVCDTVYIYNNDIQASKKVFASYKICIREEVLKKLTENNCPNGQLFYFKNHSWILLAPQPVRLEKLPDGYYYILENETFFDDNGCIRIGYNSTKKTKRIQAAWRRYCRKVERIYGASPF